MLKNKRIILSFLFIISFFCLFLTEIQAVFASDIAGEEIINNSIILEDTDPRTIFVKIINIAFGFLGVIALAIVLYAGFLWMTSEGQEDKIEKAKKILKNGLIGLAIILASWGIVSFVFRALFPSNNTSSVSQEYRDNFFQNGLGAIGNCSVESVYPVAGSVDVARNTMIMVTFREQVDKNTFIPANASICLEENFDLKTLKCSAPVNFTSNTNDNKIFVLQNEILGNENGPSNYVVYLSNDILSLNTGKGIFANCTKNNFIWTFSVSNKLDLTPPQVVSVFPGVDNSADVSSFSELAQATATLTITGSGRPNTSVSPYIVQNSLEYLGGTTASIDVSLSPSYNDVFDKFEITVDASKTKAQLRGIINAGGSQTFNLDIVEDGIDYKIVGYAPLTMVLNPNFSAGNSWRFSVAKRVLPDSLTVGTDVYYFGSGAGEIRSGTASTLAANIVNGLSANPNVEVYDYTSGSLTIKLRAKVAGTSGNNLQLLSSTNVITATSFSGGANRVDTVTINGKKDQPKNSIIQINFNEAINPLNINDYMKVVNMSDENKVVPGTFSISSDYKTVEFKSNDECAVNGCGEKIYCLPGNSNIKVEVMAASLFNCQGSDINCSSKSPYSSCLADICTNDEGRYHPQADIFNINGVMDAAANSLDANKDTYANGPVSFRYLNDDNTLAGDNLSWSFWTNNNIEAGAPRIESVLPEVGATSTNLFSPIKISFSRLMMTSTLRTGEIILNNGFQDVVHRLVNLIAGQFVGYWISSENLDVASPGQPLDTVPDKTTSYIEHAKFFEGADYSPQIGSGVKDIYQNCFKPSAGLGCAGDDPSTPYCCDGVSTSTPCAQ